MGRWSLHYRTPGSAAIAIFIAMDFDQAMAEAARKIEIDCRLVGIYDGNEMLLNTDQIKKKLNE